VGYWACKIVTGVPEAIPVVGSSLVELLRGDVSVGQIGFVETSKKWLTNRILGRRPRRR